MENEQLICYRVMERALTCWPDKIAVIDGDKRFTFREVDERANRLANALLDMGIKKGDKVAIIAPNTYEHFESHYGILRTGAVIVYINIRLAPLEVEYILNHSECSAVIVDWEFTHLIAPILDNIKRIKNIIITSGGKKSAPLDGIDYETLLVNSSTKNVDLAEDENDPDAITYTSGTTAKPKGVLLSHRTNYMRMLQHLTVLQLTVNDVYLHIVPFFHAQGWYGIWTTTGVGAVNICFRNFDPANLIHLIEKERVTAFCSSSTGLNMLSSHPDFKKCDFPDSLRVIAAGSSPSAALIKAWESVGVRFGHVYGLTEILWATHCVLDDKWNALSFEERAKKIACQGLPEFFCRAKVVRDDMTEVAHDGKEIGEIVAKGGVVLHEYYKNPDATKEAFRGGWFHSGDLGVVYEDNYIELLDRKKDMIISGGENIATSEPEAILYEHPSVFEVAVFGVPSDKWGEEVKAAVVLMPNETATEEDLINFCRERLAHYKCPKSIEFVDELPKTGTGKIMKYVLRAPYWKDYDTKIKGV